MPLAISTPIPSYEMSELQNLRIKQYKLFNEEHQQLKDIFGAVRLTRCTVESLLVLGSWVLIVSGSKVHKCSIMAKIFQSSVISKAKKRIKEKTPQRSVLLRSPFYQDSFVIPAKNSRKLLR